MFQSQRQSMNEVKPAPKKWLRLSYIPRRSTIVSRKVKPFPSEEYLPPTIDTNQPKSGSPSSNSPPQNSFEIPQTTQTTVISFNNEIIPAKKSRTPTAFIKESSPVFDEIIPTKKSRTPTAFIKESSPVFDEITPAKKPRASTAFIKESSPVFDEIIPVKKPRASTAFIKKSSLVFDEIQTSKEEKIPNHCIKKCFNRLPFEYKTLLVITTIFLMIVGVTVAVIVPVYLFVIRQPNHESSFTNFTALTCSLTTCIGKETPYRTSMITALYPFDGNVNDLSGYATGTPYGVATPTYPVNSYVGSNALNLVFTSAQYIQIPYVNLAQSFTIELWLYPTGTQLADYGIFCQCNSNSKCLSISLRNGRFTLSFDSMNTNNYTLASSNAVTVGDWTHLTVVYDATSYQQQIYINGRIDAVSRGTVVPFAGTSSGALTTIGRSVSSAYGTSYFQGRIDHVTISAGVARTACQIYNDASLAAYYPFNTIGTANDYSVNLFHGTASGTITIAQGPSGQALYFPTNTSYFQALCLPSMETAIISLSISLWINPDNTTNGGSIIHVSNLQNGSGNCYDLLTFTPTGALVIQLMQSTTIVNGVQGPVIPTNIWTHVAIVYGTANGLRIYINGQLTTLSPGTIQGSASVSYPQFITLGNISPLGSSTITSCRIGSIPITPGAFKGAIDEFRLYNRELDSQEICVLASI